MSAGRRRSRVGLVGLLVALLAATAGLLATTASADDWDDLRRQAEARQAATEAALERLEAELEHTEAALVRAAAELEGIQAAIPVAEEQLAAANDQLERLQREAEMVAQRLEAAEAVERELTEQIAQNATRGDEIRSSIGRMAREAYRGDIASSFAVVLDAGSTDEFVQQSALADTALRTQTQSLRQLEQLTAVNRNQEVRQAAVREQVAELKIEADLKVIEAEHARRVAEDHRRSLDALLAEAQQQQAYIESQRQTQLNQLDELKAQQDQLAADLAEIVRQQEAARRAAGQTPVGSTVDRPFLNPSSVNPPYVTSHYGMRFHPIALVWRLHAGVDLRTWCGTPLYAGAAGTVEWARFRAGYGNQVMVNHGYWKGSSLMSSYNHMTSFAVSGGQQVSQGQLIGYAGDTGTSAGCHLHFEVYVDGATVDPWPLISR